MNTELYPLFYFTRIDISRHEHKICSHTNNSQKVVETVKQQFIQK